jgi:hypothetical protein
MQAPSLPFEQSPTAAPVPVPPLRRRVSRHISRRTAMLTVDLAATLACAIVLLKTLV